MFKKERRKWNFLREMMGGKMLGICEAEQTLCQAQCCSGDSVSAKERGRQNHGQQNHFLGAVAASL
jgi:hypothetical protein